MTAAPVLADSNDALNFTLRHGLAWDDNLFRLPDGASPASGGGERSDVQTTTAVGVAFDRSYGLQRVAANAGMSALRHRHNTQLDSDSLNGLAAWYWRSGARFDGELSWARSEAQTSFADLGLPVRNLARTTTATAAANWWFHSSGAAGLRHQVVRRDNSSDGLAASDSESRRLEATLRYQPASGNTLTLRHAQSDARYPTAAASPAGPVRNDFDLAETGLDLRYRTGGASELSAGLSRVAKRHREAAGRDFTGATGRAEWSWSPAGKMTWRLSGVRSVGAQDDALARSTISDTVSATAQWAATAKLGLAATATGSRTRTRGDASVSDRLRSGSLSASYTPWPQGVLAASWQHEARGSDDARRDFRAQRFTLDFSWSF